MRNKKLILICGGKPYVLLFDTGILEFYRQANVAYPLTETLYGLQNLQGLQGVVRGAKSGIADENPKSPWCLSRADLETSATSIRLDGSH